MTGGSTATNPIEADIASAAAGYNVPAWIPIDIAQTESSLNPQALGDYTNGKPTSFGLFQLHWGGQGTGYTEQQLFDPVLNSQIAMVPIANAYQMAVAQNLQGFGLLDFVATHSGHPGYAGPGNYPAAESALKRVYGSGVGQDYSGVTPTFGAASMQGSGLHPFFTDLQQMETFKGFNPVNPIGSVVQNGSVLGFRFGLFFIGLILIIFGLVIVVGKVKRTGGF